MSCNSFDAAANKILTDLETIIKKDASVHEFSIIPSIGENKNCTPIIKGLNAVGLESWSLRHVYPYAHHMIVDKNMYRNEKIEQLTPCLLGVALLNPDMPHVWNKRRQLILSNKLSINHEFTVTKLALSRKPKSNEALHHRRWVIMQLLETGDMKKEDVLQVECCLTEAISDSYHSNYNAWSHRMWSFQQLLPSSRQESHPAKVLQNIPNSVINLIINTVEYKILAKELENNFNFISSHVSDHSGMHFRQYIITRLISVFDHVNVDSSTSVDPDSIHSFNENVKQILTNFIQNPQIKSQILVNYISTRDKLNLFDIQISCIINELNTNIKLSSTFTNHEALWYYRRFLINKFKLIVNNYKDYKLKNDDFDHQDCNGVSHAKDAKLEFTIDINLILDNFYQNLIYIEKNLIELTCVDAENSCRYVCDKYEVWLKQFLKIDDKFLK